METIKSSTEISELFATGKRIKTPFLTLIVKKRSSGKNTGNDEQHGPQGRVAFIAGKKLGNAVWRNQAKRRMRALCQQLHGPWEGLDVVFLAKGSLTHASYGKVLAACSRAVEGLASKKETAVGKDARHR